MSNSSHLLSPDPKLYVCVAVQAHNVHCIVDDLRSTERVCPHYCDLGLCLLQISIVYQ